MSRVIKYNLKYTMVSVLSENKDIIPDVIQRDLAGLAIGTITNRKTLEGHMAEHLKNNHIASYNVYKDFIDDSQGQIFILID